MKSNAMWFRAKRYGWGWTPNSWQGWLVTLAFIVLVLVTRWFYEGLAVETWERELLFFLTSVGHVLLLIGICLLKGERPRWRWGETNN